jgi:hypothetical protein
MGDLVGDLIHLLIIMISVASILYAQHAHYNHVEKKTKLDDWEKDVMAHLLEAKKFQEQLKDYDEYKKRVDALTLKAGFKL